MTTEWDGTAWGGITVAEPERIVVPTVTKSITGPFVANVTYGTQLASLARSPQAIMREAQALYHSNPWIRTAEATVVRRTVGLPWHLEDGEDEEIPEDATGEAGRVRDLIERPQRFVQVGREMTRREMWTITTRHIGLCGMSYWYLDRMGTEGLPTSILYVNPARVWPAEDQAGNLIGWILDPADSSGHGGTPLTMDELIPFYLAPPDFGNLGTGLVAAAFLKAQITTLADRHAGYVLGTGGRLAGIVSPKEGTIPDEQYNALVREFRNVNEAPDAAKRTTIIRGPIDFTKTAADPSELNLVEIATMNRDDIMAIWGVPPSQAGIVTSSGGLNSGETRKYEEATLMQGAVHDRVIALSETIQFRILDRWQKVGLTVELEIEEPEFDDRTPQYDLAAKAVNIPLTNAQRLALVGEPPTGDPRIDNAIMLPSTILEYAAVPLAGKARTTEQREFLGLRRTLDARLVPSLRDHLAGVLAEQRDAIAAAIRAKGGHLAAKPNDVSVWWNAKREDDRLAKVLRAGLAGLAQTVAGRAQELLRPAKADGFVDRVLTQILVATGLRISGINDTTKQAVQDAIAAGFDAGLSPLQVAETIESLPAFDLARAEMIARTESMFVYNAAALASYTEFGIDRVQAIDGDGDLECAQRNGQTYSIDEAAGIEDHPNGTLDWVPVVGKAAPQSMEIPMRSTTRRALDSVTELLREDAAADEQMRQLVEAVIEAKSQPVVVDTAPFAKALSDLPNEPVVVPAPIVNVPAPIVNIDMAPVAAIIAELREALMRKPPTIRRTPIRNEAGQIVQVIEEAV